LQDFFENQSLLQVVYEPFVYLVSLCA